MLTLDQFDYYLPPKLIAQQPVAQRDKSRLLVLDRQTGKITHHHFYDLPNLLSANDVIVRNNTKVIPARIFGQKITGGQIKLLLTKRLTMQEKQETWECLTKPGLKLGQKITFANSSLVAICTQITGYTRKISFNQTQTELFQSLEKIGHTPIPPYITCIKDEMRLRKLYQTTYARHQGSVAAPTAGLHFTPKLDLELQKRGIQIEEITLHVGLGTFLPVKETDITKHHLHEEQFSLPEDVAMRLNQAKQAQKKIVAVGTTTTRVLENCVKNGKLVPMTGETNLYIHPPHQFQFVDSLITNFHLPKSTLLMLVTAFVSQPNTSHQFKKFQNSSAGRAYQTAITEKYRFYSFGDAMLIR
ncbi:tRNA preQ1(34) S-adenosylmethionine ribosyltransferase-isomerase QueA [Patescibacteria group bacterium]|nr:tRNA preQ1(34) S-adenosylmethionine ribosyltransferase-isomerase QueA [Patescibacteria group bacterium]MBU1967055.1 tRNA preQ1(34) S-adenosylmethionine ribosyltransferase-isomerase QueA [Patescibacteria group bacterium]MBU2542995.1 tRNA preQ1(34) S-adenosylmethionine ribosyltransferase-isomerase QueA [Patescibacteria group bacterium]